MRTKFPLLLILSMSVMALMFQLSGVNAVYDWSDRTGALSSNLEDTASQSSVRKNGSISASGESGNEGDTIVSFITTGFGAVIDVIYMVVAMPVALNGIGFPWYFAYPVGIASQIIASIGAAQFAANRVYR